MSRSPSARLAAALVLALAGGCSPTEPDPPRGDGGASDDGGAAGGADAGRRADAGPGRDAGGPAAPRYERYIRGDLASRLVIEVDAVAGADPIAAAERDLVSRLSTLLDKPGGVTIVRGEAIASRGADHAWTLDELRELAALHAPDDPADGVAMHTMWLDGRYAADSGGAVTLGLAFGHRHIVMFHDRLEGSCRSDPILGGDVCAEAEYLVWLHEVGHTIGLVDNGLAMVTPHRDPDNGRHDVDDGCIMYFAFESRSGITSLRDRLLGGDLPDFDAECLADVAAVRDR